MPRTDHRITLPVEYRVLVLLQLQVLGLDGIWQISASHSDCATSSCTTYLQSIKQDWTGIEIVSEEIVTTIQKASIHQLHDNTMAQPQTIINLIVTFTSVNIPVQNIPGFGFLQGTKVLYPIGWACLA